MTDNTIAPELVPYFESSSPPIEYGHDAFLPVRVTKQMEPNGSLTVYLPNGTALEVHGRDLLRIKPHHDTDREQRVHTKRALEPSARSGVSFPVTSRKHRVARGGAI